MTPPSFASSYATALAAYVAERTERRLKAAYDLGRAAVEHGLGILDVAAAHNQAVARAAADARDAAAVIEAAGDFLVESLASFEVVQRGAGEAWRAAWEERRRTRMIRELSSVLADADVASTAGESAHELAQLVAELVREMTRAAEVRVAFGGPSAVAQVEAAAVEPEADTWSEVLQPQVRASGGAGIEPEVISATIRSIDGSPYGRIDAVGPAGAAFAADDDAAVRQVADLTGAWLDRTQQRFRPADSRE